jgi:iron complex outermembrane receptor protein
MGGYSFQSFNNRNTFFNHDSLFTDAFGVIAPAPRPNSIVKINNIQFENRLISFFGRVNFDWKDKYLVTATLRRDGSTRFGPENRWGLFPSFAAAWRISNEQFFQGATGVLNYLKLRVGYGSIGQEQIDDYLYVTSYGYSLPTAFYQFGGDFIPTLRPNGVDPNIKWEATNSVNIGVDYELFKGKLAGSIEVYQKNTKDLLFEVAFPAGINTADRIVTNIGEMRNQGIEFQITAPVVRTEDYSWNLSFNAAYNQNEIINLDNSVSSSEETTYERGGIAGDVGQQIQILKVGEAFESFYVYEQLYDDAGNPIYDPIEQTNMYKDQNGDGTINEDDLRILDNPAPDWILGLTSLFNWRNVDLSFTFRAHLGNYVYNNLSSNYGELRRLETAVPQNIHLSALETQFEQKQLKSDYYIENASFLKLDNITLGYTFSDLEWMKARAYVTAQNLLVITGYSGFDPEFNNGIDNNP